MLDFLAILLIGGALYLIRRLSLEVEELQRNIDEIKRSTSGQDNNEQVLNELKTKIDELHIEIINDGVE